MLDLLIITGASKGIGGRIAEQCNTNCTKALITISSSGKIDNVSSDYNNLVPLTLDLSDHKNVYEVVRNAVHFLNELKPIKNIGIVLCGAQIGEYGGLLDSNLDDWDKLYKTNVLGNLAVIKACSEVIKSGAKTRIAFFAGGGAAYGYPEFSGYALSKVAVVRAVENVGMEFDKAGYDASIIAVAPGAVATDMLAKVLAHGGSVKTKTDIDEPAGFVWKFLRDDLPSKEINGKFLHVRDDISKIDIHNDMFKLRRIDK